MNKNTVQRLMINHSNMSVELRELRAQYNEVVKRFKRAALEAKMRAKERNEALADARRLAKERNGSQRPASVASDVTVARTPQLRRSTRLRRAREFPNYVRYT